MKKKLEAELISIAHRILKLKNRSELEQLQQEALNLYQKLSVLMFVEDNFSEVKPTIGFASAEEKLEEIYGLSEAPVVENKVSETDDVEQEIQPDASGDAKGDAEKTADLKKAEPKEDTTNESGEGAKTNDAEGAVASEEEKDHAEKAEDNPAPQEQPAVEDPAKEEQPPVEEPEPAKEEPAAKEEEGAADAAAPEPEEEQHAEVEPNKEVAAEAPQSLFAEEKPKQKEITFEDYQHYKEPEFIKKGEPAKEPETVRNEWLPREPEMIQKQQEQAATIWEQPKEEAKPEPVAEAPKEEYKAAAPSYEMPKAEPSHRPLNESFGKTISLGLNDRIAFEKNLFGGSGEDLNRVLSQLNTFSRFEDARNFIEDLVKPDYNNWNGKEEYEQRFMELVEKRFS